MSMKRGTIIKTYKWMLRKTSDELAEWICSLNDDEHKILNQYIKEDNMFKRFCREANHD